jgi:hypothetical protein
MLADRLAFENAKRRYVDHHGLVPGWARTKSALPCAGVVEAAAPVGFPIFDARLLGGLRRWRCENPAPGDGRARFNGGGPAASATIGTRGV